MFTKLLPRYIALAGFLLFSAAPAAAGILTMEENAATLADPLVFQLDLFYTADEDDPRCLFPECNDLNGGHIFSMDMQVSLIASENPEGDPLGIDSLDAVAEASLFLFPVVVTSNPGAPIIGGTQGLPATMINFDSPTRIGSMTIRATAETNIRLDFALGQVTLLQFCETELCEPVPVTLDEERSLVFQNGLGSFAVVPLPEPSGLLLLGVLAAPLLRRRLRA